jgi:hypothetical protein
MTFTVGFKLQFAQEFTRYPQDQQDKILDFVSLFQAYGLGDFSKYPGKISPSWSGIPSTHPNYGYAQTNNLWHYHMGHPVYVTGPKYQTSDWVIHFQWASGSAHIDLVDCYQHYMSTGAFYMPPASTLTPVPPTPPTAQPTDAPSP